LIEPLQFGNQLAIEILPARRIEDRDRSLVIRSEPQTVRRHLENILFVLPGA